MSRIGQNHVTKAVTSNIDCCLQFHSRAYLQKLFSWNGCNLRSPIKVYHLKLLVCWKGVLCGADRQVTQSNNHTANTELLISKLNLLLNNLHYILSANQVHFLSRLFLSIFTFSSTNRTLVLPFLVQSVRLKCSEYNFVCTASKK